eukprot:1379956-Amorphochlora_amoeboformis.AAC.1
MVESALRGALPKLPLVSTTAVTSAAGAQKSGSGIIKLTSGRSSETAACKHNSRHTSAAGAQKSVSGSNTINSLWFK